MKISYTINMTIAMIYDNGAEQELGEALEMLDRALELLDLGNYDEALTLAREADEIARTHIYGGDGGEPDKPVEPMPDPDTSPWLYGYIVVFDEEPGEDDKIVVLIDNIKGNRL